MQPCVPLTLNPKGFFFLSTRFLFFVCLCGVCPFMRGESSVFLNDSAFLFC